MFKDGLPKGVTSKIYSRDIWPLTLDEWQAAVRREIRRRKIVMAEVGKPGEWNTSTREARWKAALSMTKSPRRGTSRVTEVRDDDRMQVDRAKLEKLSDKERERLRKRGACFFCRKDGHMVRECPEKPAGQKGKQKARATTVETEEGPPSYKATVSDVHASIRAMNKEKRDRLLEKLMEEASDEDEAKSQADEKDF
jgi:hypothetical protein